jgi:hypothetical protein
MEEPTLNTTLFLMCISLFFAICGAVLLYYQYNRKNIQSFTPKERDWDPNSHKSIFKRYSLWRKKIKQLRSNKRNQIWWGN